MTVRLITNDERWYIISSDRSRFYRSLHGPNVEASIEVSTGNKFGLGVKFGRNGQESDMGLDIHLWRLGNIWMRARAPWLKWLRIEGEYTQGGDNSHLYPRHTGLVVGNVTLFTAWWDSTDTMSSRRPREWSLSKWQIWGRTRIETETLDEGTCQIPLPEGPYDATWKRERRTSRHVRWPGTWRKPRTHESVWLEIEGGIPVEGKGENSWDCGMDGLFGIGGHSVENAIGNAVAAVLRDRRRYGGPHALTQPTTVAALS